MHVWIKKNNPPSYQVKGKVVTQEIVYVTLISSSCKEKLKVDVCLSSQEQVVLVVARQVLSQCLSAFIPR